MGKDGFMWWQGVVEDVDDPLMLGRCRVRCLGYHTDDKSEDGIPTKDLPWATPIQPLSSSAISGMGISPTGLVPGTWVVGFFRDGDSAQQPIIMGSISGIPQEGPDKSKGFNDPRTGDMLAKDPRGNMLGKGFKVQEYPRDGTGAKLVNEDKGKDYPKDFLIEEPDTHRMARNEKVDDTIIQLKKDNVGDAVPCADITCSPVRAGIFDSTTSEPSPEWKWKEPKTPYDAKYPHNHVYESESGHTIEIDDTPNKERLHTYHRSGTFEEIHPTGTKVTKVVMDDFTVILRDKNVHIDGAANVTVDKACKIFINADKEGDNHLDIHIGDNSNLNVEVKSGNLNAKVVSGDMNVEMASGNLNTHVKGNHEHYVSGDYNMRVDGRVWVQSGANQYYNGSNIHLNHPSFFGGGVGIDSPGVVQGIGFA